MNVGRAGAWQGVHAHAWDADEVFRLTIAAVPPFPATWRWNAGAGTWLLKMVPVGRLGRSVAVLLGAGGCLRLLGGLCVWLQLQQCCQPQPQPPMQVSLTCCMLPVSGRHLRAPPARNLQSFRHPLSDSFARYCLSLPSVCVFATLFCRPMPHAHVSSSHSQPARARSPRPDGTRASQSPVSTRSMPPNCHDLASQPEAQSPSPWRAAPVNPSMPCPHTAPALRAPIPAVPARACSGACSGPP